MTEEKSEVDKLLQEIVQSLEKTKEELDNAK